MSLVSSISQMTYLCNRYRIRSLLSKQKTVKKSSKKEEIRKYGYKAMTDAPFSLLKSTKHLVRLYTRETTFFKASNLLANLNKCVCRARKRQCPTYKKSK